MKILQKCVNNSQPKPTKMSSATQQREIYAVTRSEATWLVQTYMKAKRWGSDNSIEPYRVFRNELETLKPAYLGRFNNSANAAVQGTFYIIATNLYKVIDYLNRNVASPDHHKKTMEASEILPCKHFFAYTSCTYLNWAVYNWFKKNDPITEDLGDNGYECNACTICDFSGEGLFFFSTSYGLEKPVCEKCLPADYVPTAKETKSDPDYEVSEEEESDEEDHEEDRADEKDPDYVPSDESDCDEEYAEDSENDDDLESNATEETDLSASETDASETDASETDASASESESDASESDASDGESEKAFGCTGCPYEFRAGWKTGYKAAMKKIRNYAEDHRRYAPDAPRCATCDDSHEGLKKCGRCQLVRYCSEDCQSEDWEEHKRVCRA